MDKPSAPARTARLAMSLALTMTLLALIAASYAAIPRAVAAQAPPAAGAGGAIRYEHRVRNLPGDQPGIERGLNSLASEGWEVMQVLPSDWHTTPASGRNIGFFAVARRPAPAAQ